ncbi:MULTISPECIES: T9SS type A sorting domain-containing protein [unclassified Polaribacter]|uniref:T9SS type A sorting domain-containing protein n=1 Tax=unclassified Polaribacter TaxID=196858 RepID=UPI001671E5B4|nr:MULTISPECIES: T9SS type A sorting domain-containing protein [unclassified Polaribacter]
MLSTNAAFLDFGSVYKVDNQTLRITGLQSQKVHLKLYDILGKEVFKTSFNGKIKNDIRLPDLKYAAYIVDIFTEKRKVSKKIIIE